MKGDTEIEQDYEMLDEYDFRGGVRGKYYQQYQKSNLNLLPGIQFITDTKGQKLGVIIDLDLHQDLWNQCLVDFPSPINLEFLINYQGERKGVMLNFQEHLPLWEFFYDHLLSS